MNIIKRELKSNLKAMIIWGTAMIFLVSIWMIEFETFAGSPEINDFMNSIPKGLLSAIGMADLNLASLVGFVSAIALYLYLLLGIHGVLLGSSIISKEERDKTAEYLFSLPISRKKILAGKTISAFIIIFLLNLITLSAMLLNTIKYDKGEKFYNFIALLFIAILIFQIIFLSIGMLVAALTKRYKKSGNISVSILMITFLISTLINMVEGLEFLKYITPFEYFEATYILNKGSLQPISVMISILIILSGIVGTFLFYPKRDLYI